MFFNRRKTMIPKFISWFKKYFWIKISFPPVIPQDEVLTATLKVPLVMINTAANNNPAMVDERVYPLMRVANPCIPGGKNWLVIEGTRVGAVESWWEDRVRDGTVVIE
jgi:hypothetical protein